MKMVWHSWFRFTVVAIVAACSLPHYAGAQGLQRSDNFTTTPNIIFFLADDLRWDALGCYGNDVVQTPNVDALARDGVRFERAFVTTSICSVSRASILAGQYGRRHEILNFSDTFTPEQWSRTYPAQLREAGYYTGFIGKFGVGKASHVRSMADKLGFWRGRTGQGGLFIDPKDPEKIHATAQYGNEALEFLRSAPAGQPKCLSLSFTAPHARDGEPREFQPDPRDEDLYSTVTVEVSEKASQKFFAQLPEAAQKSEGRKRWDARFSTPEQHQETVKDYLRLVTGIDREVGRIRKALDKQGLTTNTVIIFTSDNGFFYGERGLADKWLMYEESIRIPLIIFDPRLPESRRGAVVSQLALNIDFAPTMLDLAEVRIPGAMQGRSLVPLVQGDSATDWRNDFFYEHHFGENRKPPIPATEGVREERWKYTRWTSVEPVFEELFDLEKDPEELNNLAEDPEHQDQLDRLRTRWKELRKKVATGSVIP